jgi:hypothetical protein
MGLENATILQISNDLDVLVKTDCILNFFEFLI